MVSHGFTSPVSLFPDICVGQDEEPNAHEYSFPSSPEHDLLPKNIGSLGVVSPLNSISSSQLQHGQFPLSETDAALTRHFLRVLSPWVGLTKRSSHFSIIGLTSIFDSLITVTHGGNLSARSLGAYRARQHC